MTLSSSSFICKVELTVEAICWLVVHISIAKVSKRVAHSAWHVVMMLADVIKGYSAAQVFMGIVSRGEWCF